MNISAGRLFDSILLSCFFVDKIDIGGVLHTCILRVTRLRGWKRVVNRMTEEVGWKA